VDQTADRAVLDLEHEELALRGRVRLMLVDRGTDVDRRAADGDCSRSRENGR
jgi:hypothetical protein